MVNILAWDSEIMIQVLYYWGILSNLVMFSAIIMAFWYKSVRMLILLQIALGIILTSVSVYFGVLEYMTHYVFLVLYSQVMSLVTIPCLLLYLVKWVILKSDFKRNSKFGVWTLLFTAVLLVNFMINAHDVYYSLIELEII